LTHPRHPYTEALLAAVPKTAKHHRGKRTILPGEPPDLINVPSGCVLHPRCKYAKDICKTEEPELKLIGDNHYVSCHFTDELELAGID
jgi:oligopeptide/dipeptide ABC transporter ATP-binding protein